MNSEGKQRLSTLHNPVSPPPARAATLSLSAIEAGKQSVDDHLQIISTQLRKYTHNSANTTPGSPDSSKTIPIDTWKSLYARNSHASGHHFVIHQHDHPIAGPHYDLRLQFSESSSVSWSIMYGLPGDANSRRLNRNATETRVHSLWNHLIETASAKTGSLIIWDTGEYEVLPDNPNGNNNDPETEGSSASDSDSDSNTQSGFNRRDGEGGSELTDSENLRRAFQNHKIHLRLHGTRLPENYTIFLHRDKSDFRSAPTPTSLSLKPRKKKRRRTIARTQPSSTSNSDTDTDTNRDTHITRSSSEQTSGSVKRRKEISPEPSDDNDDDDIDYQIRLNNAYPGSTNNIGSIHQRRWFIVLDRAGCGFIPERDSSATGSGSGKRAKRGWVRGVEKRSGAKTGFDPFYVRGPDSERSVVTGRLGRDVLRDEGVEGFVPRRGWKPVLI